GAGRGRIWRGALLRCAPETQKTPLRGLLRIWRRGGDSNPRGAINACLISSQVHSTTLPPLRWSPARGRGRNDTGRRPGRQGEGATLARLPRPHPGPMSEITVPVSFGELLDKIAILQIKSERMTDEAKLANVRRELSAPEKTWMAQPAAGRDIAGLLVDLKAVNEGPWDLEE